MKIIEKAQQFGSLFIGGVTENNYSDRTDQDYSRLLDRLKSELPVYPEAELAVVVPVYKELANGAISNMLYAASSIGIPKEKIAWVFVVNNSQQVLAKVQQNYTIDGQKLTEEANAFWENQITLEIIRLIEQSKDQDMSGKLKLIDELRYIWSDVYEEKHCYRGLEVAIARGVQVAAVDCSSFDTAFKKTDIGLARRIGSELAYDHITPNAKLISFSDADTIRSEALTLGLLKMAQTDNFDGYVISQKLIASLMPHDYPVSGVGDDLVTMMNYLYARNSSFSRYVDNSSNKTSYGGSQLSVTPDVLKKHPYPNGSMVEDFAFARVVVNNFNVRRLVDADLQLNLVLRFRPESVDGRGFVIGQKERDELRKSILERDVVSARSLLKSHFKMIGHTTEFREYLQWISGKKINLYLDLLEKYRCRYQSEKRKIQKIMRKLFQALVRSSDTNDEERLDVIINDPIFKRSEKEYLSQNLRVVNCLLSEAETHNLNTEEDCWQFVDHYMPDLTTDPPEDINDQLQDIYLYLLENDDFPKGIGFSDLLHLFAAQAGAEAAKKNGAF